MFTQHAYSRRPVITTYRRRTRIEHYIDSSEDDSDLDDRQQQPSLIPKKQQQHASTLPIVQAPSPPILASSSCRSEPDQTGLLPILSSYLSSDTATITNARDQDQQQQPDYADKPNTFGLPPLNDALGVPTDNLLLSLQQPSNAVPEHVLLREQPIKSLPYDHSLYQSAPQGLYDFAETDTPTMSDDIRLLSFPSSTPSQQQQQPASYVDGFGLAAAALSPSRQPSDAADITHVLLPLQQQQKTPEYLELGEFACPGAKTRGSLLSAGETSADDASASVAFQEEQQQQQQQQQQMTVVVEPSDIFAFPELPSAHQPRLANQNSVAPHPSAQQQEKELLDFNNARKQWTVPAKEPATYQPDVFDFPSLPPLLSHTRKTQLDVPAKTDIFDFPDEDPNDDEVIVASPVSIQQQQHSKKKKTLMKKKKKKKGPLMMTVTSSSSSSSSSSSGPSNVNRECSNKRQQQRKQVRFASEMQVSTFREQSFECDESQTLPVQDKPVKRATNNNDENRRPPSLLLLPPHQTLKRKRNLILGLKSAAGVAATPGRLRRYDFDDDEDEDETPSVAAAQVQLREEDERHGETTTPSWLDLVGSDPDEQEPPEPHRPQYQPQNPMNVRVTYGRHRTSRDPEMVELDNLLAQLRDCK